MKLSQMVSCAWKVVVFGGITWINGNRSPGVQVTGNGVSISAAARWWQLIKNKCFGRL